MATFVARASALLCLVSLVLATGPNPRLLDSDLTILTHNDLYGNSTRRQVSVVLVSKRQSHSAAASSCAALTESLWSTKQQSHELGFLQYLGYGDERHSRDLYWVASTTHAKCNAVSAQGRTQQLPCDTPLPALCQNSASLSSLQSTDTGSKWQTSVSAGNATVVGYRDKHSFRFQGIKYATIPSRFSDSTYLPLTGSVSALSYGPQCVQGGCSSGTAPCSEDCLYLNIWTPTVSAGKSSKTAKKAVMVWVHGGGFVSGSGSDTTFDGGAIASRGDVVLVTINYRLGNFGFLALEGTSLTGNQGLKDQSTALDWLHAHIDAFGGDKDKITVFGQSAGAASVRALLASPEARDKFAGAITQSTPQGLNYASSFSEYLTITEATNRTKSLLNETGCASSSGEAVVSCLQAVNALNLTTGTLASYPVVDNSFLTTTSLPLGRTAPKLNITLLSGIMHDDGSPFTRYSTSPNLTTTLLDQNLPSVPASLFPLPAIQNTTLALFNLTSRISTDAMFRCLGQSTASTAAKNTVFKNTFAYEFDRALQLNTWSPNPPACEAPRTPAHPNGDPSAPYYKCHSGELYYVFGTLVREGARVRDDADIVFAQYVLDSWAAFARTGDPVPEARFLEARGFSNTTAGVRRAGAWKAVEEGGALKVLDVRARSEGWREVEQCEALGMGLGYYDA
ncbi:Alpha/Beta hydrolase protein [Boeremia exigua]|uniref:Alpha/Beta hydrolase protein n=1 Tax=Boeremia exigua TaxID=749465 RepID=UPI001E8E9CC9|nr:Alpha/Beta hydrolase protein [Boeremia exigua]KAH6612142.1 Alpha/Beta hydrolase protein [Boeremia exigua]